MSKIRRAGIAGIGSCQAERVVTNDDLAKTLDTSDEWIRTRTGIRRRRIVEEGTATSDLAFTAAERALARAGLDAADLDLIIVATATPDMAFPATACIIQDRLGAGRAAAFDLEAACSGFVYALATGSQFIESGIFENVLIVGAETLSKITDWSDRSTAVLLGDGAGAVVLRPVEGSGEAAGAAGLNGVPGLLGFHLGADGSGGELLKQPAGGSRIPASRESLEEGLHYLKMNGREVFRFAVKAMGDAAKAALDSAGLAFEDVDLYIPHQANLRIIESSARRFGLPMDKVYVNIDEYGNTSSASIPMALDEAYSAGRVKPGDTVLMVAFGGGLTWGAAVLRWSLPGEGSGFGGAGSPAAVESAAGEGEDR